MQVATRRGGTATWTPYRTAALVRPDAQGRVFVRVRDAAGNVSGWREVRAPRGR